jgi:hypothetical protein
MLEGDEATLTMQLQVKSAMADCTFTSMHTSAAAFNLKPQILFPLLRNPQWNYSAGGE